MCNLTEATNNSYYNKTGSDYLHAYVPDNVYTELMLVSCFSVLKR